VYLPTFTITVVTDVNMVVFVALITDICMVAMVT
jgi:hypothetical protein